MSKNTRFRKVGDTNQSDNGKFASKKESTADEVKAGDTDRFVAKKGDFRKLKPGEKVTRKPDVKKGDGPAKRK